MRFRLDEPVAAIGIVAVFLLATIVAVLIQISCIGERVHEPGMAQSWSWPSMPLGIAMEFDVDWDTELDAAVKRWESDVGCNLFAVVAPHNAHVIVEHGGSHPTMKGGAWVVLVNGAPDRGTIRMYNVGTSGVAYGVLLHELGMILGLDGNDPQSWSAMNRNSAGYDSMYIRISDKDRAAVRDRYCGGRG